MAHCAALRVTGEEILEDSKTQPDGDDLDLNFPKEFGFEEQITEYKVPDSPKDSLSAMGQRARLSCFVSVATEECAVRHASSDTDSTSNRSSLDLQQEKDDEYDIDAILGDCFAY